MVLVAPDERRAVPAQPPGLTEAVAQAWRDYWADPVSQLARPVDWYDIGRYFELLSERERLEDELWSEESLDEGADGKGLIVLGSLGQPVLNPKFRIVAMLTREIQSYEAGLGILPLNRMRLGLAHTQAHASFADLMRSRLHDLDAGAEVIDLEDLE